MEEETVSFSAVFFAKEERVNYRREERESKLLQSKACN